jgi:hypothetical protein
MPGLLSFGPHSAPLHAGQALSLRSLSPIRPRVIYSSRAPKRRKRGGETDAESQQSGDNLSALLLILTSAPCSFRGVQHDPQGSV